MDEGGVDAAVIHPPALDPNSTALALQAVRDYPRRFAIMGAHDLLFQSPNGSSGAWAGGSMRATIETGRLGWSGEVRQMSAIGTRANLKEGQSQFGFAPVVQTSTCSAMARASSTSMPRYLTVLSIFVCPNSSCTARKLSVRR